MCTVYCVAPASATPPTQVLLTVTTPTDQQTYMMQFSSSKAPTGVTPTSLSQTQTTASLVSQSPKIYLLMSLKLNPATPLCTGHPKPNSALRPFNEHLPAS